jgi:hypothetical protein
MNRTDISGTIKYRMQVLFVSKRRGAVLREAHSDEASTIHRGV